MTGPADRRPATATSILVSLAAAAVLCATGAASATAAPADDAVDVPGASVVGREQLTERTVLLTVETPSFAEPQPVEVTLPVGYDEDTTVRWPVTYYLGGLNSTQATFRSYDGEAVTAGFGSIIVSPRGGAGYWNDWFNAGRGGPPMYETFVVDELVPLVDANFRTVADRGHRAIMGESGGGYGALLYAAKHPDVFVAVSSLSGAGDITGPEGQAVFSVAPTFDGGEPNAIHGPYLTEEVRWRGNNPVDLAGNLGDVDVQMFIGSGTPSTDRGEEVGETVAGCPVETTLIRPTSITMHEELLRLGIDHRWVDLPWGCHSVSLFRFEIAESIPTFARLFAEPPAAPGSFDHRSIDSRFTVWDWTVEADPARAVEFLDVRDAGSSGFALEGSGTTTVTTPPLFVDVDAVRVTGAEPTVATPDEDGRLVLAVDLGPANTTQAFTAGAANPTTTAVVTFEPEARAPVDEDEDVASGGDAVDPVGGGGDLAATGGSSPTVVLGLVLVAAALLLRGPGRPVPVGGTTTRDRRTDR